MIALLAAAGAVLLAPEDTLARYALALAAIREPRVFTVEYTIEQTGARTLEQTHRIFRSGGDERDETLAVNGNRLTSPAVRVFRGRRWRYAASSLAPRPGAYDFAYAGPRRSGRHSDYVFRVTRRGAPAPFTVTQLTIDGATFLPASIAFATAAHGGRGTVAFGKAGGGYWVVSTAAASARTRSGTAAERLTFSGWRFPASLPRSTFAIRRPAAAVASPP